MDAVASSNGENSFLASTSERADLNQYWFSTPTISMFVDEIVRSGGTAALVSSPSVYFSLPEKVRERCKVLDFDRQWSSDPGYVFYDFNDPEDIPAELKGNFDFVLVDPPFITREVWEKYAATTKLLCRDGGHVLCTTIAENDQMMQELLEVKPVRFRPSIPNLVYQYSVYTNYTSALLDKLNPEIDDDDWMATREKERRQSNATSEPEPGIVTTGGDSSHQQQLNPLEDLIAARTDEDAPPPPGVECLTEFRGLLNGLKRSAEGINAPLQTAIRRREAGGEAAVDASKKAESALDAAAAAVATTESWLDEHRGEVADALGETSESFNLGLAQDRWRTKAVADTIAKARNGLESMTAYNNFVLVSKQHTAAIFRSSNLVLDRIKALKRAAQQSS
eukprot:gnl/MRDRNA2_/MRDRNA2_95166_c0_seq1.p1 gnl/MRDRNA2_/MRDRNA2_95166_c0~~gnl/MRDRNA2_/MRDRNA2_95166_c0_seq1.p1  ORF type:complete len:394 (-),score=88.13 gnl/MRDRNA2_/MRDRNA2_95166_c0_seq1:30-1211(-)